MERTKLTLCSYENPGALKEIEHWEKAMSKSIISKWKVESELSYAIGREDKTLELMMCTPLDTLPVRETKQIMRMANNLALLHGVPELKYYKTLIFGRVEEDQLRFISTMMMILKNKHL